MNTRGDSPTAISRLRAWLGENKTWIFSGIGIAVPLALIGWLIAFAIDPVRHPPNPTNGTNKTGSASAGTGIANTGSQTIKGGVEITGGDIPPPENPPDEPGSATVGTGIANTGNQTIHGPVTIGGTPREEQP